MNKGYVANKFVKHDTERKEEEKKNKGRNEAKVAYVVEMEEGNQFIEENLMCRHKQRWIMKLANKVSNSLLNSLLA